MISLGIDCGTQGTKTVALDGADGRVLAHASAAYGLLPGLPLGHLEQDPAVWVTALEETVARVLEQLGARRAEVGAIGVSGQQHGFVPLDAEKKVIRPAKLWCDTSTEEECILFRQAFGGAAGLIDLAGNDVLPGFTAPKILWLKRREPEHFARLRHILLPHDYLNLHLTGALSMEWGDASGTALLDIRTREWCAPLVEFIDPRVAGMLPSADDSRKATGTLKPELAAKWGLSREVVVSAGGGDNMMGAIGTGNVRPGVVTASLGTSGTLYAHAAAPVIDPRGEIAAFCGSTGAWLPLLCTMNVTVATEAVRSLFSWDHTGLDAAVQGVPPGADGLLFLPYLQGERTPNLPRGSGVLHGLTTRNFTPGHFARAVMEGVTLGLAYGLRRLKELGIHATEIRLTGGGSQSAAWRKLCAEAFGLPVVTLKQADGAALGAAIQALAAREGGDVATWTDRFITPERIERPAGKFDYGALLDRQTALTSTLAEKLFL